MFPDSLEDEGDARIIGYQATNELEIEFDDFAGAQTLIHALFEAGATNVRGPDWSVEDPTTVRRTEDAATRNAVSNARRESEAIALALGMELGPVLRVSDAAMGRNRYTHSSGARIVVTGSRIRSIPIVPQPVSVSREIYIEFSLVPPQ